MLDTLDYSESLTDAGVPPDQARLQAKALSEALESNDLATKTDMSELRSDMKSEMAELRSDMKSEMAKLRSDMKSDMADMRTDMANMETRIIKWQIGGIGVLAAIMKFL